MFSTQGYQVKQASSVETDHEGQPLTVNNVLHFTDQNLTTLLEQPLVRPGWVDPSELRSKAIMLAHEKSVNSGQADVLVYTAIASREALYSVVCVAARRVLALWQRRLGAYAFAGLEQTTAKRSQLSTSCRVRTVHLSSIDERCEQIQLLSMTFFFYLFSLNFN